MKIYVFYPRGKVSGGPEALHQLVDSLRRQGATAYLVAYPETLSNERSNVYLSYDAPEAPAPSDSDSIVVVAGENKVKLLATYRRARRVLWWLAIDSSYHYRGERLGHLRPHQNEVRGSSFLVRCRDAVMRAVGVWRRRRFRLSEFEHATQSAYAFAYIGTREVAPPRMLSDFTTNVVPNAFLSGDRDIDVAYNATKSDRITRLLAKEMPGIKFHPIVGMSRGDVASTLSRARVYLDLGPHPGKDRMPREAALAGCVVVVSERGAGLFFEDVPLPSHLKVDMSTNWLGRARTVVQHAVTQGEQEADAMASYRDKVLVERKTFDEEVARLFLH